MKDLWKTSLALAWALAFSISGIAGAVPSTGSAVVEKGTASVTSPSTGNLQVAITGNSALIKWAEGLSIAQGQSVRFGWTGSQGNFVVNYVPAGIGQSAINGTMAKIQNGAYNNGHVWLINPSGIAFGQNAVINFNKFSAIAGGVNPVDVYNFAGSDSTSRYLQLSGNTGVITVDGGAKFIVGNNVPDYSTRLLFVAREITIYPGVTISRGTTDGTANGPQNASKLTVQLFAAGNMTISDNGVLNNGTSNYYSNLGNLSVLGNATKIYADYFTAFGSNVNLSATIDITNKYANDFKRRSGHVVVAAANTLDARGLTVITDRNDVHFNISGKTIDASDVTLNGAGTTKWAVNSGAVADNLDVNDSSITFSRGRFMPNTTIMIGDDYGTGLITKVMPNGSIWFQTNSFASAQLDAQMAIQRNWQPSSSGANTSITGLTTGATTGVAVITQ